MPAIHERGETEGEPSAKRQLTAPLTPLGQLAEIDAPSYADEPEGCSTPVDPDISHALQASGQGSYPAEDRLRRAGLTAFCDALAVAGLRDELSRFTGAGVTILAPTNEAFACLPPDVRHDARLVRQLVLGHVCAGVTPLAGLKEKECAIAVAGQTHAVYEEGGRLRVGTAGFGRATDMTFNGGIIHEVSSVLLVLWLVRDSHSEQVWKKSLQPSPIVSAIGGTWATGIDYEVHGCLLHAASGALVPEALRGHVRTIKAADCEQRLAFNEITVLTKPPSLAKRRGVDAEIGNNRYRLLFSVWNAATRSYVSWQHMATPLVVRNSFHMLPIEEKNYRRTQYARSRGRPAPLTAGRDDPNGSGDSGRARSDSDDGESTQHAYSAAEGLPSMPRLSFDAPAEASAEEFDLSAAGALCAMAMQMQ